MSVNAELCVQLCKMCESCHPNFLIDMNVQWEIIFLCTRRTDKLITSLFLSGMHRWIVHQFITYFPMRVPSFFFPHFPSLLKAGFEKRSFGVSRKATGEQIPADRQKKNSFKRACNTTVNCIRQREKKQWLKVKCLFEDNVIFENLS